SLALLLPGPPPPDIHTLSLHDALPISGRRPERHGRLGRASAPEEARHGQEQPALGALLQPRAVWRLQREHPARSQPAHPRGEGRSEEHTSELQSLAYLVCRLLLEKKKK